MNIKKITLITLFWLVILFGLFLYSFTQIDLGLTLTRVSFWQSIQKNFQAIGYFQRPLSTYLYLSILFLLFIFYFIVFYLVRKNKLSARQIWILILLATGVLWLSFNAFSYDLFNYIFDARIVTFYHLNPYQHKALDFLGDPMLGFMHWTHRLYPYGPSWLLFTIPLSFLGFQKLLPTMILFKGLEMLGYLGGCFYLYRILKKLAPQKALIGLTLFAFNPLVIVESLVSAHHDILMMGLVLAAFWNLIERKYLKAWVLFILSIGIKYVTGLLLPVFLLVYFWQWRKLPVTWPKIWGACSILMIAAIIIAIRRLEMQPWYLLYLVPFLILWLPGKLLFWPITFISLGNLLTYVPFLYLGNWNPPVPVIKTYLVGGSIILSLFILLYDKIKPCRQ
jgi:hypothetical protein